MSRKSAILSMHQILIRRRDALRGALADDLSVMCVQASDNVATSDSLQMDVNLRLAEAENRELSRIEHALNWMRGGHYGICEICGENIPLVRLNALPHATCCIGCQRGKEELEVINDLDV